jgi:hypothetical protein
MAVAERMALDSEFAAQVEAIEQQAKERKAQAKGEARGKKKASLTQIIVEEIRNRSDNETAAALAKAHGTNRTDAA